MAKHFLRREHIYLEFRPFTTDQCLSESFFRFRAKTH
jgi:hypothetical protein